MKPDKNPIDKINETNCEDGVNLDLDDVENYLEENENNESVEENYSYKLYAISVCHHPPFYFFICINNALNV